MRKIQRILIANRGEIALRIIRTVREMNIEAVAIYEKQDRDAYFHRFADRVVQIGDEPNRGYLDMAPTPSTPDTAFCRRTPILPRPVRKRGSSSSVRPRR